MDAALIIDGVVDTVCRNIAASEMPGHPTGQWVEAPAGGVFGGFLYVDGEFVAPEIPEPEPPLPTPTFVASGNFTVIDGMVENPSVVSRLPAAFAVDVGVYWVFFSEEQPDTDYIVIPNCSEGRINVAGRFENYFEICVKDDGGASIDPSEFSVSVVRTQ